MSDFSKSSDIVGQFLPKVYTRRITLEDSNIVEEFFERITERNQQTPAPVIGPTIPGIRSTNVLPAITNTRPLELQIRRMVTPATAVTIDYHIKDVLTESGLGVITKTAETDDKDGLQEEILSALKVVLVLIKDPVAAERMYSSLQYISTVAQNSPNVNVIPTIKELLDGFRLNEEIIVKQIPGRPAELNFQVRNSRYQQYDINNNPINIIPYSHTYLIDNQKWSNCDNLSLITFTYFDFESLRLEDLMNQQDIDKLSWIMGDMSLESIISNGAIESTSVLYKDFQTGQPYYGPVHLMEDGRYMTGYVHGQGSERVLTRTRVPMRKIQDFRKMQRTKLVNFQPGSLESFADKTPSLSFLEKENKNFFGLDNVMVDLDRATKSTDVKFSANIADIYRMNSRYYDIFKNLSPFEQVGILLTLKVVNVEILRKRVTRRDIGNGKFGAPQKRDYDQDEIPIHKVANSGQASPGFQFITPHRTDQGVLLQRDNPAELQQITNTQYYKTFYANDLQIGKLWNSRGVYQYGVKITLQDNTKKFFSTQIHQARRNITMLKKYLSESQVPVFDTRNVRKVDETEVTTLELFSPPSYSNDITQQGNYDPTTGTFTEEFIKRSLQTTFPEGVRTLRRIADNYLTIVKFSFGKTFVALASNSVSTIQNDNSNIMQPDTSEVLLDKSSVYNFNTSREAMVNMIHPINSRPELIQSFIKSYEDVVLEMENYFDFTDIDNTIEGRGFTAKVPSDIIEVQRWFSDSVAGVDEDNYVYLDRVYQNLIYTSYDFLQPRIDGPRFVSLEQLNLRFQREIQFYGATSTSAAALTADSITIGNDKIYFKYDEQTLKEAEERERRYFSSYPGYVMKRIIPLSIGLGQATNTATQNGHTVNKLLTLLYSLPNDVVANAISTINLYDTSTDNLNLGYFYYVESAIEFFRNNAVDYGQELHRFRSLQQPEDPIVEIECDGVTLREVEEEEIVDLGVLYQTLQSTMPTINRNLISTEITRLPDLIPGITSEVDLGDIVNTNMVPIPTLPEIPQFTLENLQKPEMFPDGVITLTERGLGLDPKINPSTMDAQFTQGATVLLGKGNVNVGLGAVGGRGGFGVASEVGAVEIGGPSGLLESAIGGGPGGISAGLDTVGTGLGVVNTGIGVADPGIGAVAAGGVGGIGGAATGIGGAATGIGSVGSGIGSAAGAGGFSAAVGGVSAGSFGGGSSARGFGGAAAGATFGAASAGAMGGGGGPRMGGFGGMGGYGR